jgi:hypothetical protein
MVELTALDVFARPDGMGVVIWPHVNVNALRKQ